MDGSILCELVLGRSIWLDASEKEDRSPIISNKAVAQSTLGEHWPVATQVLFPNPSLPNASPIERSMLHSIVETLWRMAKGISITEIKAHLTEGGVGQTQTRTESRTSVTVNKQFWGQCVISYSVKMLHVLQQTTLIRPIKCFWQCSPTRADFFFKLKYTWMYPLYSKYYAEEAVFDMTHTIVRRVYSSRGQLVELEQV